MRTVRLLITVFILFTSISYAKASPLTYPETKVLCWTILGSHSGEDTYGFIQKYTSKYGYNNSKHFLKENELEIQCSGRPLIYFTIYRGHYDDVKALIDSGLNPNDIIKDYHGRKMTMLDYVMIVFKAESDDNKRHVIKEKIKVIRKARGKTCKQLGYDDCIFSID